MAYKTPEQISAFLNSSMYRMDQPAQLYGDEPNSYRRPWAESTVKTCLFACWAYEQAAGNLAIPTVYRAINEHSPSFLCDRSYFPATPRDLRAFEGSGIPIFGIESRHQLADFDVIGTSISYPVLSINLIKQLTMSDIPPLWEERQKNPEQYPMVIVGGQLYGAPEVCANIADVVFCGEVEDEPDNPGIGAVLSRIEAMKKALLWQTRREFCYEELAKEFNFLYFPRFIDVLYGYESRPSVDLVASSWGKEEVHPSKQVIGYYSRLEGMLLPIRKRIVKNLDAVEPLDNPPLLYVDPGMGANDVEVQRGCPAWCTFCALTYRQKPYRQRTVDYTVDFAQRLLKNTGGLHIAPFGPDFPMHTQKKKLISELLGKVTDEVDASSMRVDDFIADPSYILLQAHGGMDTVTLGVEGNSQRMRDLVGKGSSDQDIMEAVARAIQAGIKKIKLYMIASLPGEDEQDIYRILQLAKDLADIRDQMSSTARLQFSWTPMLIEGNTPFQWFAPTTANWALGDVWEAFRELKVDFKLGGKAEKNKLAYFQATQRASREVGKALVEAAIALNKGCWGGAPAGLYDLIEERLVAHGFLNGLVDVYDERQKKDLFGWEMIDQGINSELLWVTYQQMREFLEHTSADTYDEQFGADYHGSEWIERCDSRCMGKTCGVCDTKDLQIRRGYIQAASTEIDVDLSKVKVIDQKSLKMKIRARVMKADEKRFVDNSHFRYAVRRAAALAGLSVTKRYVKFSSDAVKIKNWASGADYLEFGLTDLKKREELESDMEAMKSELASSGGSLQITDWAVRPAQGDDLRSDVDLSLYEIELDKDPGVILKALEDWHAADYIPMIFKEETRAGVVREEVNGKLYVDDLWLVRKGHRIFLHSLVRGKANPYQVVAALLGQVSWIELAKFPAHRIEAFLEVDRSAVDFFRPSCEDCGDPVPITPLDKPYSPERCPKCLDKHEGSYIEIGAWA